MTKAKIAELKNNLSRYLDRVRHGDTIMVFDRTIPIAEIIPIRRSSQQTQGSDEAFLLDLERRGIVRRGTGKIPANFKAPTGKSRGVLAALLKERREGR